MDKGKERARFYADMVVSRPTALRRAQTTHATSQDQIEQVIATRKNPKMKSKVWIGITILTFTLLIGLGASLFYLTANRSPLDPYTQRYAFPLYYPSKLPGDYTLAKESIKPSANLLIYRLESKAENKTITFNLQALPSELDVTAFARKGSAPVISPIGTLYSTNIDKFNQHMLVTNDGTLIVINTSAKIETSFVNALISKLKKVE